MTLNLASILPPRTRHWIRLMMDRVIQTTGAKFILGRSEYNNFGLTLCSETCQGRHLLLYYDNYKLFIIISKNVLSTVKDTVGNGFVFCDIHLFTTYFLLWSKNEKVQVVKMNPFNISITVKWKIKYWRMVNFSSLVQQLFKKYQLYVQHWR